MIAINEAKTLKAELDSLRPLKKEDELRIWDKFRLDWNYHSNNLEGNSLTYGETKALILHNITAEGKPLRDHIEIAAHDKVLRWIMDITKSERPITENFIRELHEFILKEPYEVDAITPDGTPTKKMVQVGKYKEIPNHVKTKTGEIFRFATPEETPAMMTSLIDWYRNEIKQSDFDPILTAAMFHYKFIRIHPFDDGNGRTARILMNFILMQYKYPPAVIKTDDKQNYFSTLQQADGGTLEPFINYITTNLNHSLKIMIKGAKGLSIEEPDDLDKELIILKQKLKGIQPKNLVHKDKNVVLDLFDKSVKDLVITFVRSSKKFDKFYTAAKIEYSCNTEIVGNGIHASKVEDIEKTLKKCRKLIKESGIEFIGLEYKHLGFKNEGIEKFDYKTLFSVQFDYNKYRWIFNQHYDPKKDEKYYSEYLSDEEIIEIVNSQMRKHQQYIEAKISETG